MTTKFTLEIKLGNDLMHNGGDVARVLHEISQHYKLVDAEPLDRDNDFIGNERSEIIIDGNGSVVGSWRIAEQQSGEAIARQVLANHSIRSDWVRSGEQIIDLIDEGVRLARGER